MVHATPSSIITAHRKDILVSATARFCSASSRPGLPGPVPPFPSDDLRGTTSSGPISLHRPALESRFGFNGRHYFATLPGVGIVFREYGNASFRIGARYLMFGYYLLDATMQLLSNPQRIILP
ncbi:hypothetical protein VTH06DRAFT_3220 [Thermothelomyces fergusii]